MRLITLDPGHFHAALIQKAKPVNWAKVRILVYTRNSTGQVHDNIPASIEAIKALGHSKGDYARPDFRLDVRCSLSSAASPTSTC